MEKAIKNKTYKSPRRKLVVFFEKSRNQWKTKCQEAKKALKLLKNRIRFLEESKNYWKNRVKELEDEVTQLKANEQARQEELDRLKKKIAEKTVSFFEPFTQIPFHHKYSVAHIQLFLTFVLSAAASLRCASRIFEVVMSFFQLPLQVPSWSSGRFWLLRLGYYKLMCPKEISDDWVWIIDHTAQAGEDKCFFILGLRLSFLPQVGKCLSHEDVEPIEVLPVKKSNGEIVYEQLEAASKKTGIPREIICDKGTDLNSGVEKFCMAHPETSYIYDIKHKIATILKRELSSDEIWQEFTQLAGKTKHQINQTPLAFLMPPNQKSKARYMNVDTLIQWGGKLLNFLDNQNEETKKQYDPEILELKLGWIIRFRKPLDEWNELLEIIAITENFVRTHGLYHGASHDLEKRLTFPTNTNRTRQVQKELVRFVAQESFKAKPKERLLGSSEVIESVFGKLKRLEKDQAKNGFTSMILSIAAMVSSTTKEIIQKAMETVPTKKIPEWCSEKIGQSVQSKRKRAFAVKDNEEQKWDQLMLAG